MPPPTAKKYAFDVVVFAISQVALYYAVKYVLSSLDPMKDKKKEAKAKSEQVLGKLGRKNMKLNEYEEVILSEVIFPEEISINFKQIGGLDPIIQSLRESVIYPLTYPHLFTSPSGLLGVSKGVLLHGPPGCGKTMLAKALARESGATFINLHVSTLTDKWFGESNKLVSAVFSVAKKLEPCIIFIDEIDAFLRERRSSDHEVTGMMKAEFMSLWDGLTTDDSVRIIVLGATNRPNDIDYAILRRMPKRFAISLPNEEQRKNILDIMLQDQHLENNFDIGKLVAKTANFSGSDLKEACRNAAMIPIREYMRSHSTSDGDLTDIDPDKVNIRPMRLSDFFVPEGSVLQSTKNTVTSPGEVEQEQLD
ncbi:AAA-domain-containing protein [Rhizophagus irregularis]|uniref:AAA-domain-containing protein n=3 Tax=Rhizophagus irregularis TaxID=588596 RepID=A0A2I1E8Q0_9GLOM|nr:P-loop containing nucleoside triphosphate hydrolase protein [Rhizophagus irregularis DAOM 181602=DAOM 197198]EXX66292.1 Msp1p [Rhizophagus irregularis DAOM 197198w]PKC05918.1 AAA-domain-containing protein [Rhizophagus irregularis]PKC69096.1 AAA-domain-containing protein [Rhizophagus irregularis]PKK69584.1 AAA-domain-containing protein [Rhizophagus irregularis]PKY18481.1 AAA-domain-containing protein [Rhizophagus irregularis]|eukprot:XP_025180139.1 P-loop containing nucleoside triphosphate hydrolase protein [Rhizophagus irregularis DAOM 181602=DAOM 197198]